MSLLHTSGKFTILLRNQKYSFSQLSLLSVGLDDDPDDPASHGVEAAKKQKLDEETKMAPKQQQLQVQRGASGGMGCPFCKAMFPSEAGFVEHLTKAHKSKVLMKCKDCDFKARTGEEIRSHREEVHNQPRQTSGHSKSSVAETVENDTNKSIMGTKVVVEKPSANETEASKKPAPRQQQLQVKSGASGATMCPFCKLKFPAEAEFVDHLTKVHNSKVLMKCKDCDFKAKTGTEIRSHREQEHNQPKVISDQSKLSMGKGADEITVGPKVTEERPLIDVGDEAKVHKNPNMSSWELITEAMDKDLRWGDQGRMPLYDIYRYISQKYPYFKPSNQRWKKCQGIQDHYHKLLKLFFMNTLSCSGNEIRLHWLKTALCVLRMWYQI